MGITLQKCGINGHLLRVLQSMYKNDKACIKLGNEITETFPINIGVKQGDNPSPTLFNLYLHDLPELFIHETTGPVLIKYSLPIGSLLWPDHLTLISNSEEGLRAALVNLETYCYFNQLSINISKTKYIRFSTRIVEHIKESSFFRKKEIEFVRNFTYLEFNISLVGNIKDGLFVIHKRAQTAFYQLKNQLGDMCYREPVLAIKLFDALVKPVLLYCSDFWGCSDNIFSL